MTLKSWRFPILVLAIALLGACGREQTRGHSRGQVIPNQDTRLPEAGRRERGRWTGCGSWLPGHRGRH
jgi:hypothetical protein